MRETSTLAQKKTVPAMLADTDFLFRQAKLGASAFIQAQPFPHLLLPSLIKSPCCYALYEALKAEDPLAERVPSIVRMLLWELSSSTLLRHFSALTAKPPLLPDPFMIHAGAYRFAENRIVHSAEQEYFARHPETQLQNVLRMELFVSSNPGASFELELVDKQGHVGVSHCVNSGAVLFVDSDHYHLRYQCDDPREWCSLIAYYYINDRARVLNGEEQARAAY